MSNNISQIQSTNPSDGTQGEGLAKKQPGSNAPKQFSISQSKDPKEQKSRPMPNDGPAKRSLHEGSKSSKSAQEDDDKNEEQTNLNIQKNINQEPPNKDNSLGKPVLNSNKPELDSSRAGLDSSRAGLDSNKAGLDSNKAGLDSNKPASPFDLAKTKPSALGLSVQERLKKEEDARKKDSSTQQTNAAALATPQGSVNSSVAQADAPASGTTPISATTAAQMAEMVDKIVTTVNSMTGNQETTVTVGNTNIHIIQAQKAGEEKASLSITITFTTQNALVSNAQVVAAQLQESIAKATKISKVDVSINTDFRQQYETGKVRGTEGQGQGGSQDQGRGGPS